MEESKESRSEYYVSDNSTVKKNRVTDGIGDSSEEGDSSLNYSTNSRNKNQSISNEESEEEKEENPRGTSIFEIVKRALTFTKESNYEKDDETSEHNETERISESGVKDSENSYTENTEVKHTDRSFEFSDSNQYETEYLEQLPNNLTEARAKVSLTKRAGSYVEYGNDIKPVVSKAEVLNFDIPEEKEDFEEDDVYPLSIKYDK